MEVKLKTIEKIEALFKQAENTPFEEEARAFMEKAQELLTKYSLSEYDVRSFGESHSKDSIINVAVILNDPHVKRKMSLFTAIAKVNNVQVVHGNAAHRNNPNNPAYEGGYGFDVRTISSDKPSKNYRPMYCTGFSKDIEATTLLFTSLLIQGKAEVTRAEIPSWVNRSTWVSHCWIGFTSAIGQRLRAGKKTSTAEVVAEQKAQGFDLLPVLVQREKQVQEEYSQKWAGKLRTSRSSYTRSSTGGISAGRDAGNRSDIGNKRLGGVGALGA